MTSDMDMRRLCEWCGKELAEDRPAWTLYCDTKCRNAAGYELERVARIEAKAKRPPCPECGAPIPAETDGHQIFCSKRCYFKADARRVKAKLRATLPERTCPVCATVFQPSKPSQKHCSPACALSHARSCKRG